MGASMKKLCFLAAVSLLVVMVSGCSKPDNVTTINSPTQGVFYTVETSKASGPTSDTTRVYAHLERNGKERKLLVLDGEDLTVEVLWKDSHNATFCLDGGITDTFRNEVTLIVGDTPDDSERIYNHLSEHCGSASMTSPNVTN
jgi:hypothetical protein